MRLVKILVLIAAALLPLAGGAADSPEADRVAKIDFGRQLFEETMAEAQKQMKAFDVSGLDAAGAKARTDLARAAFEKALANMQALAEGAQKANAEAYDIVAARIKESIAELRQMAAGKTAT